MRSSSGSGRISATHQHYPHSFQRTSSGSSALDSGEPPALFSRFHSNYSNTSHDQRHYHRCSSKKRLSSSSSPTTGSSPRLLRPRPEGARNVSPLRSDNDGLVNGFVKKKEENKQQHHYAKRKKKTNETPSPKSSRRRRSASLDDHPQTEQGTSSRVGPSTQALPPSLQAVVQRHRRALSADELEAVRAASPNTRCDALRMVFEGRTPEETIQFIVSRHGRHHSQRAWAPAAGDSGSSTNGSDRHHHREPTTAAAKNKDKRVAKETKGMREKKKHRSPANFPASMEEDEEEAPRLHQDMAGERGRTREKNPHVSVSATLAASATLALSSSSVLTLQSNQSDSRLHRDPALQVNSSTRTTTSIISTTTEIGKRRTTLETHARLHNSRSDCHDAVDDDDDDDGDDDVRHHHHRRTTSREANHNNDSSSLRRRWTTSSRDTCEPQDSRISSGVAGEGGEESVSAMPNFHRTASGCSAASSNASEVLSQSYIRLHRSRTASARARERRAQRRQEARASATGSGAEPEPSRRRRMIENEENIGRSKNRHKPDDPHEHDDHYEDGASFKEKSQGKGLGVLSGGARPAERPPSPTTKPDPLPRKRLQRGDEGTVPVTQRVAASTVKEEKKEGKGKEAVQRGGERAQPSHENTPPPHPDPAASATLSEPGLISEPAVGSSSNSAVLPGMSASLRADSFLRDITLSPPTSSSASECGEQEQEVPERRGAPHQNRMKREQATTLDSHHVQPHKRKDTASLLSTSAPAEQSDLTRCTNASSDASVPLWERRYAEYLSRYHQYTTTTTTSPSSAAGECNRDHKKKGGGDLFSPSPSQQATLGSPVLPAHQPARGRGKPEEDKRRYDEEVMLPHYGVEPSSTVRRGSANHPATPLKKASKENQRPSEQTRNRATVEQDVGSQHREKQKKTSSSSPPRETAEEESNKMTTLVRQLLQQERERRCPPAQATTTSMNETSAASRQPVERGRVRPKADPPAAEKPILREPEVPNISPGQVVEPQEHKIRQVLPSFSPSPELPASFSPELVMPAYFRDDDAAPIKLAHPRGGAEGHGMHELQNPDKNRHDTVLRRVGPTTTVTDGGRPTILQTTGKDFHADHYHRDCSPSVQPPPFSTRVVRIIDVDEDPYTVNSENAWEQKWGAASRKKTLQMAADWEEEEEERRRLQSNHPQSHSGVTRGEGGGRARQLDTHQGISGFTDGPTRRPGGGAGHDHATVRTMPSSSLTATALQTTPQLQSQAQAQTAPDRHRHRRPHQEKDGTPMRFTRTNTAPPAEDTPPTARRHSSSSPVLLQQQRPPHRYSPTNATATTHTNSLTTLHSSEERTSSLSPTPLKDEKSSRNGGLGGDIHQTRQRRSIPSLTEEERQTEEMAATLFARVDTAPPRASSSRRSLEPAEEKRYAAPPVAAAEDGMLWAEAERECELRPTVVRGAVKVTAQKNHVPHSSPSSHAQDGPTSRPTPTTTSSSTSSTSPLPAAYERCGSGGSAIVAEALRTYRDSAPHSAREEGVRKRSFQRLHSGSYRRSNSLPYSPEMPHTAHGSRKNHHHPPPESAAGAHGWPTPGISSAALSPSPRVRETVNARENPYDDDRATASPPAVPPVTSASYTSPLSTPANKKKNKNQKGRKPEKLNPRADLSADDKSLGDVSSISCGSQQTSKSFYYNDLTLQNIFEDIPHRLVGYRRQPLQPPTQASAGGTAYHRSHSAMTATERFCRSNTTVGVSGSSITSSRQHRGNAFDRGVGFGKLDAKREEKRGTDSEDLNARRHSRRRLPLGNAAAAPPTALTQRLKRTYSAPVVVSRAVYDRPPSPLHMPLRKWR